MGTEVVQEDKEPKGAKEGFSPSVRVIDALLITVGVLITVVGIIALLTLLNARTSTAHLRDRYEDCVDATTDLALSCYDLTAYARIFVLTGNQEYFDRYYNEYFYVKRREYAVETLKRSGVGTDATQLLIDAYKTSGELIAVELHAMAVVANSLELDPMPKVLAEVNLTPEESKATPTEARELGEEMLFSVDYDALRSKFNNQIDGCAKALKTEMRSNRAKTVATEEHQQTTLLGVLGSLLLLLAVVGLVNRRLVLLPLRNIERHIQNDEPFDIEGSREIRKVADAYNTLYEQNKTRTLLLERMAQTDPLTGLYNRGSFDQLLSQFTSDMALLAVDVDLFKEINDQYGHEVGDRVLQKVAFELRRAFDSEDYCCRIGGDEFAVVVVDSGRESRLEITTLLKGVCENLRDGSGETPAVTLSIGIAFGSDVPEGVTVYHAADKALYAAKRNGRNQYAFFEG